MKTYSVVVVDDHILLSQAIGGLVNDFANFDTLYVCKNGSELLKRLKTPKNIPDLVLMDINMPILNGIETTEYLKDHFPEIKVLALSIEEDENTIIKMLRAGAKGYLMKDTKKAILEKALLQVMKKGSYHTNTISQIIENFSDKEPVVLSEKEVAFIKLACSEMNYKEIADTMFISPKTVENYRDSLYKKLAIKNRIGLVLYAIQNSFFKP